MEDKSYKLTNVWYKVMVAKHITLSTKVANVYPADKAYKLG